MEKIMLAEVYLKSLERLKERYEQILSNTSKRELESVYSQFRLEVRPIFNGIREQFPEDQVTLNSLIGLDIGRYISLTTVDSCICYLSCIVNGGVPKYLNSLLENAELLKEEKLYSCSMLCVRLYCEEILRKRIPESEAKGKTLGKLYECVMNDFSESQRKITWDHIETINQIVHNSDYKESLEYIVDNEIRWVKEFREDVESLPVNRTGKKR